MDYYYIIVSTIFITLLILILSYYGVVMHKSLTENQLYPPKPPSDCPDYWTVASDGSCIVPPDSSKNTGNLYNANKTLLLNNNTPGFNTANGSINFTDSLWNIGGAGSLCNKKKWSTLNNIMWDGVSNYNSC